MRVIILDVNGVIMEKADDLLIRRAMAEYGPRKTLSLIASYRFGKLTQSQRNFLHHLVAWAQDTVGYMPQALNTISALHRESDTKIKICSNFASKTDADERLIARLTEDTKIVPENITLLSVGESKLSYYQQERMAIRKGSLWVLDDSKRNIRDAQKAGADHALLVNARKGLVPFAQNLSR